VCKNKCKKLRSCGKHNCSRRCCDNKCPPCEKFCEETLSCTNHKCNTICHPGKCGVCPQEITLFCHCQQQQITVTCQPKRILEHLITRKCDGEHIKQRLNCDIKEIECGKSCGNLLECGNHKCTNKCHLINVRREIANDEENENLKIVFISSRLMIEGGDYLEDNCSKCEKPCNKSRNCKHPCPLSCHLNDCPPCSVTKTFNCHCNVYRITVPCFKTFDSELMIELLSCKTPCHRELKDCNHLCSLLCHPGKCPSENCQKRANIRCKCKKRKEVWTCDKAREYRKKNNIIGFSQVLLECNEQCKLSQTIEEETNNDENSEEDKNIKKEDGKLVQENKKIKEVNRKNIKQEDIKLEQKERKIEVMKKKQKSSKTSTPSPKDKHRNYKNQEKAGSIE